jgi:hypothetical protein
MKKKIAQHSDPHKAGTQMDDGDGDVLPFVSQTGVWPVFG